MGIGTAAGGVSVSGFLNVAKEPGCTSHDVVAQVRRRLGRAVKVGHCGTLDPAARGVLVLVVGAATRLAEYVVKGEKEYQATIRLGVTTDTDDLDGKVIRSAPVAVSDEELIAALGRFRGTIMQAPPAVSAVKHQGERAYARARRGEPVELAPRSVTISELAVVATRPPVSAATLAPPWSAVVGRRAEEVELRIVCGAGTYIRALARDLGAALGCGAAVAALTRTRVGGFTLAAAVPQATVAAGEPLAFLIPADVALAHLPAVELTAAEAARIIRGEAIGARAADPRGVPLRLRAGNELLAIAVRDGERLCPKKVLVYGD